MLVSAVSIRSSETWEFFRFFVPEAVLLIGLHFGLEGNCFLGLFLIFGLVPVAKDEVDADADAEVDPLAVVAVVVVIVPEADVDEASEVRVSRLVTWTGRLL